MNGLECWDGIQMVGAYQTVLIIEDDEDWGEMLSALLQVGGYRTRLAQNGTDGIRKARRSPPDLIILDVMMPGGMDGFMTLCALRKHEATAQVPIIMCTEVNAVTDLAFNKEELARYLNAAPSVFIEKPVNARRMLEQVDALIGPEKGEQASEENGD